MKYLPAISISSVISTSLLFVSYTAQASDISFTPRASFALTAYKFSQPARTGALAPTGINGNDFPELDFEVTFKVLGIGGTFSGEGYYFDLSAQQSSEEEDSFTLDDPLLTEPFVETFKGDRQDFALTLGTRVLENQGSIFLGYKTGKSEASGNKGQYLKFEEKGLFIGANYGWTLGSGRLSFNAALADLEGELTETVTNPQFASPAVLSEPLDINATSDAQGLSYGLSWSSRISKNLSYSLSYDTKKYTFENVKDNSSTAPKEFEEELTSLMLAVYFQY